MAEVAPFPDAGVNTAATTTFGESLAKVEPEISQDPRISRAIELRAQLSDLKKRLVARRQRQEENESENLAAQMGSLDKEYLGLYAGIIPEKIKYRSSNSCLTIWGTSTAEVCVLSRLMACLHPKSSITTLVITFPSFNGVRKCFQQIILDILDRYGLKYTTDAKSGAITVPLASSNRGGITSKLDNSFWIILGARVSKLQVWLPHKAVPVLVVAIRLLFLRNDLLLPRFGELAKGWWPCSHEDEGFAHDLVWFQTTIFTPEIPENKRHPRFFISEQFITLKKKEESENLEAQMDGLDEEYLGLYTDIVPERSEYHKGNSYLTIQRTSIAESWVLSRLTACIHPRCSVPALEINFPLFSGKRTRPQQITLEILDRYGLEYTTDATTGTIKVPIASSN
ncbi:hypothetical protein BDN72DRAFT_860348 [Pluteus cervinus]|uniref:Uncharacterized protein n=1 Tax=Pluteus cervinus TaxID=181527 RepID=A0ACD3AJ42_9AGAR|nr:hypothetical protein BDN72DRAFT_860348 [Pluteus cervinus]